MATFVVRVTDDDQGYADEWVMGGFRSRDAAETFAERVEARIKNPDQFRVHVNRVSPPRLGPLEEAGWFDDPEPRENNPYANNQRDGWT